MRRRLNLAPEPLPRARCFARRPSPRRNMSVPSSRSAPRDTAPPGISTTSRRGGELLGILALVALAAFLLRVSWRRWNHPLVDFGRELHIPWRLSEGAVLYRDVDDVYGPFSQYFNAGLFSVFGPGLIVLVIANLAIATAIVAAAYGVFRRAWGAVGAWTACGLFLSLFAFNQAFYLGNFNYVTPYAHEATHGVLVCLALVALVGRWLEQPTHTRSFGAGLCLGLTLVIKPEFILAGFAVITAAVFLRWRAGGRISGAEAWRFGLGACIPTALFFLHFVRHLPVTAAAVAAGRAWTSLLVHSEFVGLKYQLTFMGLDQPWSNLLLHARKSFIAAMALAGFVYGLRRAMGLASWPKTLALGFVFAAALTFGLLIRIDQIGACLLALLGGYLIMRLSGKRGVGSDAGSAAGVVFGWRILIVVLGVALMARMVLAGRIVQFGFFQAAVATMALGAIFVSEAVAWLPNLRGRQALLAGLAAALAVPGIVRMIAISQEFQRLQTFPVGLDRDQFFTYPPEIDATGAVVRTVVEKLAELPREQTLLALPEASMINYLSRRPSPLPQFQFHGFTTEGGREAEVVNALTVNPPDIVVIVSRDLRDFGVKIYGERDGAGRQIMRWIAERYEITHKIDNDPLDSAQCGAYILQKKSPVAPGR